MHIAAFVVGLITSLLMLGQSFMVSFGGSVISVFEPTNPDAQSLIAGAGIGFLASILGIIGAALAFKYFKASGIILLIAFIFCIIGATTTYFVDLAVWGSLLLLSSIFSFAENFRKAKKASL
ncbi:MAG TPA: hypothetical protein ENF81_04025 [Thermotogaceae bacterium]|nr:hypothetical protein [Thermotogaceae bacterium]